MILTVIETPAEGTVERKQVLQVRH
jgi:hypothetical protein